MKVLYVAPTSSMYGDNIALLKLVTDLKKRPDFSFCFVVRGVGDLTKELDRLGYDYFICRYYWNLYPPLSSLKDFLFLPLRIVYSWIKNIISLGRLVPLVHKYSPDIIHTNNGLVNMGYYTSLILGIPHIWHLREYGLKDVGRRQFPSKRFFEQKLKSGFNYSIAITKGIYEYFNLQDRAKVIYDGVFSINYRNKPIKKEDNIFLYVGRLTENKGLQELLNAFSLFARENRDHLLLIVGDGDEKFKHKLKCFIKDNDICKNVLFLGYRKDVYDLMSQAKALIVPSRFEAFGFITAEAMLNKCLVIGKNTGGTKEQFDNLFQISHKNLFIRYESEKDLLNGLYQVRDMDINEYISIVEDARKYVTNLYSIENSSSQVINFYNTILKS